MGRTVRSDPTKCLSGKHDWVPENLRRNTAGSLSCKACGLDRWRERYTPKPRPHGPRGAHAATQHLLEDVVFLFETGLGLHAIAAKFDMRYESLVTALRRNGSPIKYDRTARTWRLTP